MTMKSTEAREKKKIATYDKELRDVGSPKPLTGDNFEKKKQELIGCLGYDHLLTVWDRQTEKDMNKVILQALKKGKLLEKEALTYALTNNRTEFIGYILKKVNITDYLTNETLLDLYYKASNDRLVNLIEETSKQSFGLEWKTKNENTYKLSDIDYVIKRLTEGAIDIDQHKEEPNGEQECWQRLFLYSVLNGFDKMAEDFWARGQEAIPTALSASKLYKCLASLKQNETDQWKERMQTNAKNYEDWAYEILTRCHEDHRAGGLKPYKLLTRVLPNWGNITCLNLAESAENLKFLSHPVVKDLLDDEWNLEIISCRMLPSRVRPWDNILEPIKLLLFSVFPFLIPFGVRFRRNSGLWWLTKIWTYYKAPRTVFRHNVVSHIVFIVLFSYNLLWGEFIITPLNGSALDRLLFAWVISMLLEEARQMLEWDANKFDRRFLGWWSDHWNKIDVLAQLLFLLGTFLRYSPDPIVVENARIVLAFDLFIFYFRLLDFLTFVKRIGPKVFMIGRMFIDLGFFVCILFIVLIGYGVSVHVILYPQVDHPKAVFESVLYRPYFQIYGELFLEEITATPDDGSCTNEYNDTVAALGEGPCARHPRIGTVLLGVYLAFTNVLLLNMLIAMFSNTFTQVQEQNVIHWKCQRYALQKEFMDKPMFPPPLIFISHLGRVLLYLLFLLVVGWDKCFDTDDRLKTADFHRITLFHRMRKYYHEGNENDKKELKLLILWEERNATQFKQARETLTETVKLQIPKHVRKLSIIEVSHEDGH
ncbi:transient receptor potential cation channel subfamily M member 5-like [Amphiura filiformis]|uniref:transient receptor potential cation channel subfamily M member 5-like n=1 Tax=Amphiura filiformis TaxID=82378 RepID=UPI003B2215C3